MPEKTSGEQFFNAHAPIYDDNVFVQDTAREAAFLLERKYDVAICLCEGAFGLLWRADGPISQRMLS
jgi:hypothetical protein